MVRRDGLAIWWYDGLMVGGLLVSDDLVISRWIILETNKDEWKIE